MKVTIDLTEKCNLKCKHCGNANDSFITNGVDVDFVSILKEIPYTITKVDLLGGEPLLYDKLDTLFNYLAENRVEVSLISNGQFGDEVAKYLSKKSVKNISISIDGLKKENDEVRGAGSFDKAVAFLNSLLKYRTDDKMMIGVNIVINRLNCGGIYTLIHKLFSQGVDYIRINRILESGRVCGTDLLLDDDQYLNEIEKICIEFYKSDLMKKISFDLETPFLAYYLNIKYHMENELKIDFCDAAQHSVYINARGNIYPCRAYNDVIHLLDFQNEFFTCAKRLIEKTENIEMDIYCNDCFLKKYCFQCPLNKKNPTICKALEIRFLGYLDKFKKSKIRIRNDMFVINTKNKTYLVNPSFEKNYIMEDKNRELISYFNTEDTLEKISVQNHIDYYVLADFVLDLARKGGCELYESEKNYC